VKGGVTATKIDGKFKGLTFENKYGFHIHEKGDVKKGCESTGLHYNPTKVDHGDPSNPKSPHHVGDLGNITGGKGGTAAILMKSKDV